MFTVLFLRLFFDVLFLQHYSLDIKKSFVFLLSSLCYCSSSPTPTPPFVKQHLQILITSYILKQYFKYKM